LLAVIIAALLAYAMRQFHLVAVRAGYNGWESKFPVSAAAAPPRLGYFVFWKSHDYTS